MLSTDKIDFSKTMISCFQNFRANISQEIVCEWFDELKSYEFFHVQNAFRHYVNENDKYPPSRGSIIKILRKNLSNLNENDVNNEFSNRSCGYRGCEKGGNEVHHFGDGYLCVFHWEEWALKNENLNGGNEIQATRIRLSRQFEKEAKGLGVSNRDFCFMKFPQIKKMFENPEKEFKRDTGTYFR